MNRLTAVPAAYAARSGAHEPAAAARLAALLAVAATGSFLTGLEPRAEAFFLLTGLVAVPWSIAVLFASEDAGRGALRPYAWAGDLLVVFAFQVLVPDQRRTALLLSLVVVVAAGYFVRATPAWTIAGIALALTLAAQLAVPSDGRTGAVDLGLYAAALAAVTVVAERVAGERRRAAEWATHLEGRAATILDKVADAVVLTDERGTVLSLNRAAERLVGSGPRAGQCAAVLGLRLGERPLDCAEGCALLRESPLADGAQVWRPTANGRRQPLLASAALVPGSTRDEVVHSFRDITKLMEADEAKTLFLATASHELKTPLTVISGFSQMLARNPDIDPNTQREALLSIYRRSVELSKIVDRLLLSSRIEAGRLSLTLEEVDARAVVAERVEAIKAATGRLVTFDGPATAAAYANADAIATVVDHLVDNAVKYSPEDATIHVALDVEEDAAVLRVRDGGVGMDPDQADHCFDKFWQADATDSRRVGGTGIGLYIVRSLVDAMGGVITVESELGKGTEFVVRLPCEPPAVPAPRTPEIAPETSMIREFMRQIGVDGGGR